MYHTPRASYLCGAEGRHQAHKDYTRRHHEMISSTRARCHQATLITGLLGSGKTWNLVDRLLKAAESHVENGTDLQPGSLLTLVGTRNYDSVQEKVDLHRPLGCRKCEIVTFPALAQAIVHDHGPPLGIYAGNKRTLENVELSVFLHRHLDKLHLGKCHPKHFSGDAVRPLLELFSSLAHSGVDPDAYLSYVTSLEVEVARTTGGGELEDGNRTSSTSKDRRMKAETEAWFEKIAFERDKANAYKAFEEIKQLEEVVDYGDLLLLARRILRESASAQAELSLRLSHAFVDDLHEYSPAMMDILKHMVSDHVPITATADPFLEAWSTSRNGRNAFGSVCCPIALFKQTFPEAVEIRLLGSRGRSTAIVQAMGTLNPHERNPLPSGISSKGSQPSTRCGHQSAVRNLEQVRARDSAGRESGGLEVQHAGGRVTCSTFSDEEQEMAKLGERIQQLVCRGVRPGDIGVVVLGGVSLEARVVASLNAAGVPVGPTSRYSPVLKHETPRTLMSLLRCLVHPSESPPLLHLLMHCPAYALPTGDLAEALEGHLSRYIPLRAFLRDLHMGDSSVGCERLDGVSDAAKAVAAKLLQDLDRYGEMSKRSGVREIMLAFLRDTGQLGNLQEPRTQQEATDGLAVARLFDIVRMAEKQAGSDNITVVEPTLRLFRRHGMSQLSRSTSEVELGVGSETAEIAADAVRVAGIAHALDLCHRPLHSIFVPFCKRSLLPGPLRVARLPLPGPFRGGPEPRDTSSIRATDALSRVCHENRARSMLYATVASAREELHVSVAAGISRGKRHFAPSPFLAEIFGDEPREVQVGSTRHETSQDTDGPVRPEGSGDQAGLQTAAVAVAFDRSRVINDELGKEMDSPGPLGLSFSSINSYDACPYNYYLQYVLCVSPPPSPRMVYGKAMHEAVAACLRGVRADGDVSPPTLEMALEEFNRHFVGCSFESESQVHALTAQGAAGLKSFVSRLQDGSDGTYTQLHVLIERKFRVRVPETHAILSGVFDRIDVVPGDDDTSPARRLVITDYKSSVGGKNPETMVKNSLQLRLYSLAGERIFGIAPAEVVIESIEDGRRGIAIPDPADARIALEVISASAAGIRAGQFGATPSFLSCTFCGFKHTCPYSIVTN